jgi:predicted HAD superfamily phosphohydrolase YqeG
MNIAIVDQYFNAYIVLLRLINTIVLFIAEKENAWLTFSVRSAFTMDIMLTMFSNSVMQHIKSVSDVIQMRWVERAFKNNNFTSKLYLLLYYERQ